ncbi:sepiapterin reductase-like [Lineus longissimus]|uniref:sepiapterin reductase-like n=1 Tax=Lineus longissimus TaxID=88925 RepID=UPI00315C5103
MKKSPIFDRKTFLLVTGASRGLGRSLAVNLAKKLGKQSFILLLARNKDGLEETKTQILKNVPDLELTISLQPVDLSQCSDALFDRLLKDTMTTAHADFQCFNQVIIVHNAASLGDVSKKVSDFMDAAEYQEYWNVNITSPAILNNVFLHHFPASEKRDVLCINISSICALQPFKTWALYCTGKTARDMWFNVLAVEEPSIRVLSYAPGPLDTDMQMLARTVTGDNDMREVFLDMHQKGGLLTCDVSVKKLIQILETNTFESGAHIDYFDVSDTASEKTNNS